MSTAVVVLACLVVVAIALVAVGRVTARLNAEPPLPVYDLEQAVEHVAEHLPFDVSAQLGYDDVRAILSWHLDYLEAKGVAAEQEWDQLPVGPLVAADDEGVAYVLGRAEEAGLEVEDTQVVEVLEAEVDYLRAIGAIGSPVPPPQLDDAD
ncbi:MAG: hypothetical protein MUF83_11950 [Acidimicrobiales bacterium]|nr:hypothetical protein [Acidimicrobiales bacterium]